MNETISTILALPSFGDSFGPLAIAMGLVGIVFGACIAVVVMILFARSILQGLLIGGGCILLCTLVTAVTLPVVAYNGYKHNNAVAITQLSAVVEGAAIIQSIKQKLQSETYQVVTTPPPKHILGQDVYGKAETFTLSLTEIKLIEAQVFKPNGIALVNK